MNGYESDFLCARVQRQGWLGREGGLELVKLLVQMQGLGHGAVW